MKEYIHENVYYYFILFSEFLLLRDTYDTSIKKVISL